MAPAGVAFADWRHCVARSGGGHGATQLHDSNDGNGSAGFDSAAAIGQMRVNVAGAEGADSGSRLVCV